MIAAVRALGFDLLAPERIAWAACALVIALAGFWAVRRRARARRKLVSARLEPRLFAGFSPGRAHARVVLGAGAAVFAALALVGPVRGYTLRDVERKGLDLVVCLDTSRSMLVQDVRPDRLARAKREIAGLLSRLRGDRAALIAFAGDVREVAPLTHDRETLKLFLETLTPADNVKGGTDLGGALTRALELFDGRTGAHEAIVLVTDGEDLTGQGLAVAEKAKERGIRVYVLGMGTQGGGKIPGDGGFVRAPGGDEVVSKMSADTLRGLARATGGEFLGVEDSALPLEELYLERITQLEGRALEAGQERIPHDRYQWPLVLAAALLLLELALGERRPGGGA